MIGVIMRYSNVILTLFLACSMGTATAGWGDAAIAFAKGVGDFGAEAARTVGKVAEHTIAPTARALERAATKADEWNTARLKRNEELRQKQAGLAAASAHLQERLTALKDASTSAFDVYSELCTQVGKLDKAPSKTINIVPNQLQYSASEKRFQCKDVYGRFYLATDQDAMRVINSLTPELREAAKQNALTALAEIGGQIEAAAQKAVKDLEREAQDAADNQELKRKFKTAAAETVTAEAQAFAQDRRENRNKNLELERKKEEMALKIRQTGKMIQNLMTPENLKLIVGGLLAVIVVGKLGWEGVKIATAEFQKMLNKPELISETSRPKTLKEWFLRKIGWFEEEDRLDQFTPPPGLERATERLLEHVKNAQENELPYRNALFYGKPGTGKTMYAKCLAKASGMDYAIFSGADFGKFEQIADAVTELENIIKWGYQSPRGLIIFVDEAECFLQERKYPDTTPRSQQLTNKFLMLVEKPSNNKIMWIFATNNRGVLDSAVESRISESLEFKLPDANGRKRILLTYLEKGATESGIEIDPKIEQNFNAINQILDGLSGRDIQDIAIALCAEAVQHDRIILYNMALAAAQEKKNKELSYQASCAEYQKARYGINAVDNKNLGKAVKA